MATPDDGQYPIRRGEQVNELQAQYFIDCPVEPCEFHATGVFRRQKDAYTTLAVLVDDHVRNEHRGWN